MLAYHSPMPPARTGVADYSAALVRAFAPLAEVRVNPRDDVAPALYNIANNQLHREIYRRALAHPGAALIHDAVLHHFHLGTGDERAYVEEFVYNYGEWNRGLAAELWQRRAHSAQDPVYFAYPMLRRIAETSRVVLVHNPAAARMVREHAPEAGVMEVPHLFEPPEPPAGYEVVRLREQFGPGAFVFGLFGHLRESKRVIPLLRAFARVRRDHPNAWLVVAGEFVSEELARAAEPHLREPGVVRVPYQPDRGFWLWAHAVDACVNLRYPGAGETSGIAIRLAGIGKCMVVTAGEEYARWPETACVRVDAGQAESEMLETYLRWLVSDPEAAREIGRRGREHVAVRHSPQKAARAVWNAMSALQSKQRPHPTNGNPSTSPNSTGHRAAQSE